jgi:hypothetical protein
VEIKDGTSQAEMQQTIRDLLSLTRRLFGAMLGKIAALPSPTG